MHELPLHPLTVTYWMIALIDRAALPLAEAGAEMLDQVKDPGFAQWLVYLLVAIYVLEKVGGAISKLTGREVPAKREISGTVVSREEVEHAEKSEVDELKRAVESLRAENASQHQAAATAGQSRVQALSEVVDSETTALSEKIDAVKDKLLEKIEEGFAGIHEKLNAVAIQSAKHDAMLPPLAVRVAELERKHSDAVGKLHDRINDVVRLSKK